MLAIHGAYMNKIILILMMLVAAAVSSAFAAELKSNGPAKKNPVGLIRDGFSFPNSGIEGLVIRSRAGNKWFFSPYADFSDMRSTVLKGWQIELLPSSTLEKIVGEMDLLPNKNSTMEIKLWGKVTKYSNQNSTKRLYSGKNIAEGEIFTRNFIYPLNFIAISTVEATSDVDAVEKVDETDSEKKYDPTSLIPEEARKLLQTPVKKEEKEEDEAPIDKMTSDSIIPKSVINKFKLKRVENLAKWKKSTTVEKDVSLSNRTGFVTQEKGYKIFSVDAMGRNVDNSKYRLLECETLQWIEQDIAESLGRSRYKVSGTVTKFKGEDYMLLQRTVRTYNHGNFAR